MKNIYCYLICFILFLLVLIIFSQIRQNYIDEADFPKIIHQTAPADKSKWPKQWFECQKSWKEKFPDFQYILWTDEDNYDLIKYDFPWFLETYENYDKNILRVDMIRYFILYKFGGIYADMDYLCVKNFFDELPKNKVSISESPYKFNEHLQNALMCSPKNDPFWLKVIDEAMKRVQTPITEEKTATMRGHKNIVDVLYITGPKLITDVYENNKKDVHMLPADLYNPEKNTPAFDNPKIFTKHYITHFWHEDWK